MARTPAGQFRRIGITVGLPALAAVMSMAVYVRWLPRLPDRLATHFGQGMRADGFTATSTYPFVSVSILLGLGAFLGLLALAMRSNPIGQRTMSATAGGLAVMMLVISVLTLHLHLDLYDPGGMVMPGWHLAGTVGGLLLGGGLGWLLAGSTPAVTVEPPADVHEPANRLAANEAVNWRRSVRSPVVLGLVFIQLQMALLICFVASWWTLTIWIPVFVLLAAFAWATVVVDETGLTIRLLAGWPRIRVPVTEIHTAYSRDIDPMGDFGGWGWRSTSTAGGFILRSGPGLWVHRRRQGPIAVTVPDADEAAALLNGLRDRHDGAA